MQAKLPRTQVNMYPVTAFVFPASFNLSSDSAVVISFLDLRYHRIRLISKTW
jgi:hypothetical protein